MTIASDVATATTSIATDLTDIENQLATVEADYVTNPQTTIAAMNSNGFMMCQNRLYQIKLRLDKLKPGQGA